MKTSPERINHLLEWFRWIPLLDKINACTNDELCDLAIVKIAWWYMFDPSDQMIMEQILAETYFWCQLLGTSLKEKAKVRASDPILGVVPDDGVEYIGRTEWACTQIIIRIEAKERNEMML